MPHVTDVLYEAQGRFDQIRVHIEAGRQVEGTTEAKDGVIAIGEVLESIGYFPNDVLGSDIDDRLYEAQGVLDQIRIYLECDNPGDAKVEAEEWIANISQTLEEVGYTPPPVPGYA
jgi:hypothetical protein